MKKAVILTISGIVQGVGFRYYISKIAAQMSIKGFVENLPNGNVYIEAEGDEENIADFIDWCRQGPARAIIEKVEVKKAVPIHFKSFDIR